MIALIPESWLAAERMSPITTIFLGAPDVIDSRMPQTPSSFVLKLVSVEVEGAEPNCLTLAKS